MVMILGEHIGFSGAHSGAPGTPVSRCLTPGTAWDLYLCEWQVQKNNWIDSMLSERGFKLLEWVSQRRDT